MKPAGLFLFLPVGLALVCLGEEAGKPKLSEHIRREIIAKLPVYQAEPSGNPESDSAFSVPDADLLVLPKIVVTERRLPGNDPDLWLSEEKVQRKALVAYKSSMTDFEWALNSWFIPLFTPPPSVRARERYHSAKVAAEIDRLSNVIKAVEKIDPKDAARLKKELTRPSDSLTAPER